MLVSGSVIGCACNFSMPDQDRAEKRGRGNLVELLGLRRAWGLTLPQTNTVVFIGPLLGFHLSFQECRV